MTDSIDVGESHPRSIVSQQSNMVLDHDTLLLVFYFVERANDMLNLLKSCKAFYNIGRTNLLGSPLRFKGDASRLKFQAFMAHIKKNPSDIQYVKHLSIVDIPEFGKTSVTNFALEFLQKGTNLQFLKVSRTSVIPSTITRYDDFTTSRLHLPSFNLQITSCPKLEHLNVRNLDDEAVVKILRYLDSPLKYLNISLRGLRRRSGTSRCIIYHLQKFAPHLEQLHLSGISWPHDEEEEEEEDDLPIPTWNPTTSIFPHLHTFSIQKTRLHSMASIIYAFPNLKHLSFPCEASGFRRDHLAVMEDLQKRGHMWMSLDSLHINSHPLYCFALRCSIKYLDLHTHEGPSSLFDQSPHSIVMLQIILNDIQPPRLKLSLNGVMLTEILEHRRSEEFCQLLSYSALTHFSLDVTVRFKYVARLESFIDEYLKALQSNHTIKTLCLTLRWELCYDKYFFKGDQIRIQSSYITDSYQSELAMKIVSAVGQTIKYVVLPSVESWKSSPRSNKVLSRVDGWRVIRGVNDGHGTVTLEKLTENECGRVMDARELR